MNMEIKITSSQAQSVDAVFRAAVMPAPNEPVRLCNFAAVTPSSGEVLMRTLYSEVCGTDVHIQDGKVDGTPFPIIPGHFSVGIAETINGTVTTVEGRPICSGDIITFLDVHRTCNKCHQCLILRTPTKCPSREVYGVTHSATEGPLGGWSEFVLLQNDVLIAHLPEQLDPKRFIAGGCAMPTAIHAVERGSVGFGSLTIIQGAGPVGLCAAMASFAAGARVILCDYANTRLDAARTLGFEVLDLSLLSGRTAANAITDMTGGRLADTVIEATGAPDAIPNGIEMTRDGGCYVVVGHYSDAGETSINPYSHVNRKHLDIRGTWGIEYRHFQRALDLLANLATPSGVVAIEDVLTRTFKLTEAQAALDAVRHRDVVKAIISMQP